MGTLTWGRKSAILIFASLLNRVNFERKEFIPIGSTFKEKNLLLLEQTLIFKS